MSNGDVSATPTQMNGAESEQSLNKERNTLRRSSTGVVLNQEIQKQIGNKLKNLYDEVINEEVPDRFLKLLQQLDSKSAEANKND